MSGIHRGKILHAIAKRHKKPIVKIIEDAGYSHSSFYIHKNQEDLSFEIWKDMDNL